MNVTPKRFVTGELKPLVPVVDERARTGAVYIECEVVQPASAKGRTVWVYLDVEMVPEIMRELKYEAIAVRSQPMGATA